MPPCAIAWRHCPASCPWRPSSMSDNDRYDGKPLLRLLELYILKAIGELPLVEQETLTRLAPKLQAIYGGNGQWDEAVGAAVHMPADMPQSIREMWDKNL